ncbi:hypothetical protein [Devosia nitrariae]|uniref:DUF2568 domain-containing protein n=1 Tax=Devosia nitrariae TaxID=2071872 RepID=A0ABQ5W9U5_9HYPH|nr:hypothetical protein [Devosia nitrariae]GLQ56320.1 hypothetical protein GCM10010862_35790 [Devosia nitrariae]
MAEQEPTPTGEFLRLQRYGAATAVVLLVAIAGFFTGEPLEIIFLRVMAVPLFLLAVAGIGLIFSSEASRRPWTLYFIERKALEGLAYAAFLIIIVWQPTSQIVPLAISFVLAWIVLGAATMFYESRLYKRRNPDK